ncbi:MAG: hypothetical protein LBC40_07720 [Dysgonamonadaceae bacterium]|nr:hypothetical protein [Dysgonamonadaceae bacterium]
MKKLMISAMVMCTLFVASNAVVLAQDSKKETKKECTKKCDKKCDKEKKSSCCKGEKKESAKK